MSTTGGWEVVAYKCEFSFYFKHMFKCKEKVKDERKRKNIKGCLSVVSMLIRLLTWASKQGDRQASKQKASLHTSTILIVPFLCFLAPVLARGREIVGEEKKLVLRCLCLWWEKALGGLWGGSALSSRFCLIFPLSILWIHVFLVYFFFFSFSRLFFNDKFPIFPLAGNAGTNLLSNGNGSNGELIMTKMAIVVKIIL